MSRSACVLDWSQIEVGPFIWSISSDTVISMSVSLISSPVAFIGATNEELC